MAEQAYVYIKNKLTVPGSIYAVHKLPDGSEADNVAIANANQERITLLGTEDWVEINAPQNMDLTTCWVSVRSDVDVTVTYSLNSPNWAIKITPNASSTETPTTMNVTVGNNEPE